MSGGSRLQIAIRHTGDEDDLTEYEAHSHAASAGYRASSMSKATLHFWYWREMDEPIDRGLGIGTTPLIPSRR